MSTEGKEASLEDSAKETLLHIKKVNEFIIKFAQILLERGTVHDNSKLDPPEKELFDRYTHRLRDAIYGSEQYNNFLSELKPALIHHYQNNSHHPEHYENGIDGMDLFDLVEMFLDWMAAGKRNKDGSILNSIEYGKTRFNMSDQLVNIFINTANNFKP